MNVTPPRFDVNADATDIGFNSDGMMTVVGTAGDGRRVRMYVSRSMLRGSGWSPPVPVAQPVIPATPAIDVRTLAPEQLAAYRRQHGLGGGGEAEVKAAPTVDDRVMMEQELIRLADHISRHYPDECADITAVKAAKVARRLLRSQRETIANLRLVLPKADQPQPVAASPVAEEAAEQGRKKRGATNTEIIESLRAVPGVFSADILVEPHRFIQHLLVIVDVDDDAPTEVIDEVNKRCTTLITQGTFQVVTTATAVQTAKQLTKIAEWHEHHERMDRFVRKYGERDETNGEFKLRLWQCKLCSKMALPGVFDTEVRTSICLTCTEAERTKDGGADDNWKRVTAAAAKLWPGIDHFGISAADVVRALANGARVEQVLVDVRKLQAETRDALLTALGTDPKTVDANTHLFHLTPHVTKAIAAWRTVRDGMGIADDPVQALQAHTSACLELAKMREQNGKLLAQLDGVYTERTRIVAALAGLAMFLGEKVGLREHDPNDTAWDPAWRTIVFIELPDGKDSFQASWHVSDADKHLVAHLPVYDGQWDGHSTDQKYERMQAACNPLTWDFDPPTVARADIHTMRVRAWNLLGGSLGPVREAVMAKRPSEPIR